LDRITQSLLSEFSTTFDLEDIAEDKRFEHFATYITVRREHNETFDTMDVVLGGGSDTGIDAIATIVNGAMVSDIDAFHDLATGTSNLDVSFIFVQADRGSSFEAAKIGSFGFGVLDFFKTEPSLPRSEDVQLAAEIMSAIYEHSSKFKKSRPNCHLYYVTSGSWVGDQNLEARRQAVISDLQATGLFGEVSFDCVGADGVANLYAATKNAISRTVQFQNRVELPEIPGVKEAFLGYLPISEFVELVKADDGAIIKTIYAYPVRTG
jgi:hypothetical protein